MKEEKFKLDSFIGGWYIDEKICDDLISFFEKNKHRHKPGTTWPNNTINKEVKESMEICLRGDDSALDFYNEELQKCLDQYSKKYPEIKDLAPYNSSVETYNIQKYNPKGGFFKWHNERTNKFISTRVLVFMTYLNTVKDGGTIFKYQNITTKAKKGLTLIWPTDFTHMHKGQIANQTKYIITGWYNFI